MHMIPLQWRCNGCDSVSNHQPREYLLSRLIRRRSKKTSKLRVTGLCAGNSPVSGEFPAQRASNAENVSIWWRHHVVLKCFVVVIYWSIYICLCLSQFNDMHVGKWITSITRLLWHDLKKINHNKTVSICCGLHSIRRVLVSKGQILDHICTLGFILLRVSHIKNTQWTHYITIVLVSVLHSTVQVKGRYRNTFEQYFNTFIWLRIFSLQRPLTMLRGLSRRV